jgi:hypothetical protein
MISSRPKSAEDKTMQSGARAPLFNPDMGIPHRGGEQGAGRATK